MEPSQQQAPVPANYLDQIAPQHTHHGKLSLSMRRVILFGGIAVVLVLVASLVAAIYTTTAKRPWQQLSAQLTTTQEIATSATGTIKSSQLRSYNSEVKLAMTNATRDTAPLFTSRSISSETLPKSVLASEGSTAALATLETARLNAEYDRAYVREMSFQLAKILSSLQVTYNQTGKSAEKATLQQTYATIETIANNFSSYSASQQ